MRKLFLFVFCGIALIGCEDTDLRLAGQAGKQAVQALTLSDGQVEKLSARTADHLDSKHRIAPPDSPYAKRLQRLVAPHQKMGQTSFDYQVYLSPKVNAFALGDGTIRVYSQLMDMLNDQELLFVLGHEAGHVLHEHVEEKMRLALAGSALRKGLASQQNLLGDVARSALGAFVHKLVNAQFSQHEEKEADDYGLQFLQTHNYDPTMAVSALHKLATLGSEHTFLSSHPAPQKRAQRLQKHLQSSGAGEDQAPQGLVQTALDLARRAISWGIHMIGKLVDLLLQLLQA